MGARHRHRRPAAGGLPLPGRRQRGVHAHLGRAGGGLADGRQPRGRPGAAAHRRVERRRRPRSRGVRPGALPRPPARLRRPLAPRRADGVMTADQPRRITHWIDGKPWGGVAARSGDVFDPATGAVGGRVDFATPAVVDEAVMAAAAAFSEWRRTPLSRRTQVLFTFRQLLAERRTELAALITAEHGKVLSDAAGEVQRGLEVVDFACGIPTLLKGGYSTDVSSGVDAYSLRQPIGVAAVISPFNFPAMVPMWFFPVAIACGNAVVLKPSEKDPSASVWLAEQWAEAGLPAGVFNVVHGDRETVDALLAHPDVAAVSFVGSTPVARHVYETAATQGKRVQALGGAKNHMVVLPDADLDIAADAAVSAGYGSAGERCMAISVVVAVGDIADELGARVRERAAALHVGDGSDAHNDMVPLVTSAHRERVAGYV